jgi:hypothetical protein
LLTSSYYTFYNTKGIKKVTIKGNTNGNVIDFTMSFRNSADLEIIDFTQLVAKVGNGNSAFHTCRSLREIKGELDFTECTSANTMFQNCVALEEVRVKANSLKLSISFSASPSLSANSIQSIIDGLAIVETAQTLTLPKTLTTEAESVVSANIEEIDGEIRIKGKERWTLVR